MYLYIHAYIPTGKIISVYIYIYPNNFTFMYVCMMYVNVYMYV
jgi:hypothetical protein